MLLSNPSRYLTVHLNREAITIHSFVRLQQINTFTHMIQPQNITLQASPVPKLTFPSQQELTLSPNFSARSQKEVSVTQTHCSHSSTTQIVTDSEEDSEQGQEELCESYHSEGWCMKGLKCTFEHGFLSRKGLRSALAMNFPQLLIVFGQRTQSFLE